MINVFESFSGYGSQMLALKNVYKGQIKSVGISEIDIDAIIAYALIHHKDEFLEIQKKEMLEDHIPEIKKALISLGVGYDFLKEKSKIPSLSKKKLKQLAGAMAIIDNYGDIAKINPEQLPNIDIFTFSFPCQDISAAGGLRGLKKGSNTRSSLLWECCKIIEAKKPKVLLMENVKNLVGKKFKAHFDEFLEYLEGQGYKNYYKILNSKDFGVPQNRERIFCVSVLDNKEYNFPDKKDLKLFLKDILEEKVEDKFYLSQKIINKIKNSNFHQEKRRLQKTQVCDTLLARDFKDPKCIRTFGLFDDEKGKHQAGSVWETKGLSPTLDTMQGGYRQPCIEDSFTERCLDQDSKKETLMGADKSPLFSNCIKKPKQENYIVPEKIRKLTPRECFRLMGVEDQYFDILPQYISNSQLYKLAGNSIVVNVLNDVFENTKKYFIKD